MRVVLDTNAVVSALLWGGRPEQLLAAHADLIVSGDAGLLNLKAYQGIAIGTVAEAVTRVTKAQGRCREAGSEGSAEQRHDLTNRKPNRRALDQQPLLRERVTMLPRATKPQAGTRHRIADLQSCIRAALDEWCHY